MAPRFLVGKNEKHADPPDQPARAPTVAPMRLRRVLDDGYAPLPGATASMRVHVGALPEEVHGNDRARAAA